MSSKKLEELSKDVDELNRLCSLTERSRVKDILLIETRKLETEIIKLREVAAAPDKDACKSPTTPTASHSANKCYNVQLTNYAWDQSDKFIKIFVDLPGVHELASEKVSCQFSSSKFTLTVNELNNRNYTLNINNLCENIHPDSSHWKVKKDKVVIFMHKLKEGAKWSCLKSTDKVQNKKMDNNVDPQGDFSDGIMNMMRKMYEEGDDEMKRTIAKAWTEGNEKKNKDFSV